MTEHERRTRFDDLYAQYDRRVFAYCLHVTSDRDLANDVYQEVFVKVYLMMHTVRDTEKTVHWLFRIARNECLNALKVRQRNEKRTMTLDEGRDASYTSDPAEQSDEAAHVRWGLNQLSDEHREALLLAECEGFTIKEIAEITGTSASNVKVRIHRAKQKLQMLLHPILNENA